ncbi:MAG: DUF4878 domain-containing protein [Chitinivibrionales bacterium]|nr:DUF4878 domain-containing protein [Chitinivibrionales bacterium]
MKKSSITAFIKCAMLTSASLLIFSGCSSSSSGPENVVESFFKAAKTKDFEKAVECYAPSILKEPGSKEKLTGYLKSSVEQKKGVKSFSVTGSTINENKAEVSYSVTYGNGDTEESENTCVKEDGKWYLTLN